VCSFSRLSQICKPFDRNDVRYAEVVRFINAALQHRAASTPSAH
jgi:hypothetical protein